MILLAYRLGIAFIIYHVVMAVLLMGVRSTLDARAKIYHSLWPIKIIFLIVLVSLFLWSDYSADPTEIYAWNSILGYGAIIYLCIQVLLVLDLAYDLVDRLLIWWDEEESESMSLDEESPLLPKIVLFGGTLALYCISIGGLIFSLTWANQETQSKFIILFSIASIIVSVVLSMLPYIQEANPHSGLFQPAILGVFSGALLLKSLSYTQVIVPNFVQKTIYWILLIFSYMGFLRMSVNDMSSAPGFQRISGNTEGDKGDGGGEVLGVLTEGGAIDEDEERVSRFKYSLFHLTFALAMAYTVMYLTDWTSLSNTNGTYTTSDPLSYSWYGYIFSSFLVPIFYIWSLFAPIIFSENEF